MKKKLFTVALVLVMAATALTVSGRAAGLFDFAFQQKDTVTISREEYEQLQHFAEMGEMLGYIQAWYLEEPDTDKLMDYAAKGMMAGLGDPYSVYYTADEWAKMWEDDQGEYVGIGIQFLSGTETSVGTITQVFRNGPAERAGLRKGDVLIRVEDIEVNLFTVQDAVNVMRGKEGEEVEIEILRGGEKMTFRMERASITVNRTEYTMLPDNIGYIALYEFAGESSQEFSDALADLKSKGARSLIVDLRDNPGGWVDSARQIADLFLDAGILAYSEDRYGNRDEREFRTQDGKDDIPLVMLVNENSASSSEILAGGLQDLKRATVVGTQTFGKGIIQTVNGLGEERGGFALTYAQYFLPSGAAVHKLGITPDVLSEMPEDQQTTYRELGDMSDPQLKDAWDIAVGLTQAKD